MPELPDIELYLSALRPRVVGRAVERVRVASPFFVRTFDPPLAAIEGKPVRGAQPAGQAPRVGRSTTTCSWSCT